MRRRYLSRDYLMDALVLKSSPLGEIHRSVLFLTPEMGFLSAVVHGAQKSSGRNRILTSPFRRIRGHFYHDPVKNTWKAQDLEELDMLETLATDWDKYATACLWAETVIKSQGESVEPVYRLLSQSLTLLGALESVWTQALRVQFLWRYLDIMGSCPDWTTCGHCGAPALSLGWNPVAGVFACPRCLSGPAPGGLRVLDYHYLKVSLLLPLEQCWEPAPEDGHWTALEAMTLKYLEKVLGTRLNSSSSLILTT